MNPDLPQALAARLAAGPLPGRAVQRQLEPGLCYGRHFGPPTYRAREAAVVALVYPHAGEWHLPFTVRPATLPAHAGQISLPGGAVEPGEATGQAALRELDEELGVRPGEVSLLGALSPIYVFVSEYLVTPWVAAIDARPQFRPSADEVSELLEVPLSHLIDPSHRGRHTRRQRGIELSVPHFLWGRHRIWGATAMILSELVAVVGSLARPPK
ncbi:MAG TPA: CoA pyrophosphatase [Pirellulales bacterium]|jgi:8-oxo-dGTP pyrophosphatase MutT (NUDIX family)|nr:CoA pyrophosphatase [Pirellulales bacterium]